MQTLFASCLPLLFVATITVHAQSPYTDLTERPVKALSGQERDDLLAGRGMGLALTAELNGYPGPLHVLELAAELALGEEQHSEIEALFGRMQGEAAELGAAIVDAETELDREFAERTITPDRLRDLAARIGTLQGRLREVHLQAHLQTDALLSRHQRMVYARARGYGDHAHGHGHGAGAGH